MCIYNCEKRTEVVFEIIMTISSELIITM